MALDGVRCYTYANYPSVSEIPVRTSMLANGQRVPLGPSSQRTVTGGKGKTHDTDTRHARCTAVGRGLAARRRATESIGLVYGADVGGPSFGVSAIYVGLPLESGRRAPTPPTSPCDLFKTLRWSGPSAESWDLGCGALRVCSRTPLDGLRWRSVLHLR